MKLFYLLVLLFLFHTIVYSQKLTGFIFDSMEEPIPYATIFVKELKMGTTSNSEGKYEIHVPKGSYSIQIRSLGYSQVEFNVIVADTIVVRNIVLTDQSYKLHEIRVYNSKEDQAYPIMRRVISLAPYYLNQVKEYNAEVYLKGTAKIVKVPKLFSKSLNFDINGVILRDGDMYVEESLNEINFVAPDQYSQKIISSTSSQKNTTNESFDIGLITESAYEPVISKSMISPLSPQAFSNYNFKYKGSFGQGEYLINKIVVAPKRKSRQLFTGEIYIVDGLWCLHSLNLNTAQSFGNLSIEVQFGELDTGVFLPISHSIVIKASTMGMEALATYSSSVKYVSYGLNEQLNKPELLQNFYLDKEYEEQEAAKVQDKNLQKIQEILSKENISKREALKVARLMKKVSSKSIKDTITKEHEFEVQDNYKIEKADTLASLSSKEWGFLRPKPLSNDELVCYLSSDSLAAANAVVVDSIVKGKGKKKVIAYVLGGHAFQFKHDSILLKSSPLLAINRLDFNSVEGFSYAQGLSYKRQLQQNRSLTGNLNIGYAFAIKKVNYNIAAKLNYAPLKYGELSFFGGSGVRNFSENASPTNFLNAVSSLMFKENYSRYYQQSFMEIENRFEIVNGLLLHLSLGHFTKNSLQNNTNFSIVNSKKEYHRNDLYAYTGDVISFGEIDFFQFKSEVEYTPFNYFKIIEGRKEKVYSKWPTFTLAYKAGWQIKNELENWGSFELGIKQLIDVGLSSFIDYQCSMGDFYGKDNMSVTEFKYFTSYSTMFDFKSSDKGFYLLPNYTSTNEMYFSANFKYKTPRLLLKYLPVISNAVMNENIHLNYLRTNQIGDYFELGYSVSELMYGAELGYYSSFNATGYIGAGFRLWIGF
ncbi:MAG: DUF5686 and carboxypeptidase regulatory-like domain-containing protein [Prolixibacteraceae bacterium]|jgi:hypothetical protein|nr:DUF5686 and carboxypeptidase regulatory-like domain-containing protein [Prolixibacteraceae bacterium]